jgi:hypothetical protein
VSKPTDAVKVNLTDYEIPVDARLCSALAALEPVLPPFLINYEKSLTSERSTLPEGGRGPSVFRRS